MKFLIVFAGLIAVALAAPQWPNGPGGFHGNNPHPSIGGYGGTNQYDGGFGGSPHIGGYGGTNQYEHGHNHGFGNGGFNGGHVGPHGHGPINGGHVGPHGHGNPHGYGGHY